MPELERPPDLGLSLFRAAADRIRDRVARTPMLSSRALAELVRARSGITLGAGPLADRQPRVFLKAEHLQISGSFKVRGACNTVATLEPGEGRRGLVTVSAGNHAQAVAYAAAHARIPVTVVMPAGASLAKAAAAAAYGAEVILHGEHVGETFARMEELRAERGLTFVHPFDDVRIIAGQGTVGLEVVEDLPEVDVVVVGVGGGGLISGIAAAVKQLRPGVRIYGVEPERSNAVSAALEAGEVVHIQPVSIADGLGAPFSGRLTTPLVRRWVDEVILVDEPTTALGVRTALERMKQLLEPAGAAALGALLRGAVPVSDGETVCVVASGGNVDLGRLGEILALSPPENAATLQSRPSSSRR